MIQPKNLSLCLFVLATLPIAASSEVPRPLPESPRSPWSDVATLSYVATSGNSEGKTLGFSNECSYRWSKSAVVFKAGLLKVASATVTRSASGEDLEGATVTETRTWKTTAESYYLNLRNDNRLTRNDRWYWFSGVGWERNRPTGLEDRFAGSGGFGRILVDSPNTRFRTDLGFGFTDENPVVETPATRSGYWTAACNAELKQRIGPSAHYSLEVSAIEDLSDSADSQLCLKQSLTASLNKSLALKVGYELKYRNRPNLVAVAATSSQDASTPLGEVYIPARKMDTLLTTSLVATF
ncbi:MAG: putative salt-induced outer membrane protein YdiY [Holophagaceae bacterium]|nr:putative salt-induced outer membrane protein YdiY [Holophagaceae bacterium]